MPVHGGAVDRRLRIEWLDLVLDLWGNDTTGSRIQDLFLVGRPEQPIPQAASNHAQFSPIPRLRAVPGSQSRRQRFVRERRRAVGRIAVVRNPQGCFAIVPLGRVGRFVCGFDQPQGFQVLRGVGLEGLAAQEALDEMGEQVAGGFVIWVAYKYSIVASNLSEARSIGLEGQRDAGFRLVWNLEDSDGELGVFNLILGRWGKGEGEG